MAIVLYIKITLKLLYSGTWQGGLRILIKVFGLRNLLNKKTQGQMTTAQESRKYHMLEQPTSSLD